MSKLLITGRAGEQVEVEAQEGLSVMEIIRDAGFDEQFALCGGSCSCATCHVYVDAAYADAMPAMADCEQELLEGSSHRLPNSRLSCQVPFTSALDGLAIRIAPED